VNNNLEEYDIMHMVNWQELGKFKFIEVL